MTVERSRPKSIWRRIERWMVGLVMAVIAFVLEKMVLRSIRKAGRSGAGTEELPTTLTSKGGEVDLTDAR
ncbi:MAG TPA: hypothetical protein VJP03_04605 [Actinomycetota bacterium]|jgi:hypothetical protein|nr:hypothetical protein [Actinomycetota bacterium]